MDIYSPSYSYLKFKGFSYSATRSVKILGATRSFGWQLYGGGGGYNVGGYNVGGYNTSSGYNIGGFTI